MYSESVSNDIHRHKKWKRGEFIAAQIKDFEADRKIQLMMTMLDWSDRELYFPAETGKDPIAIRVGDALLCSALLPHNSTSGYYPNEMTIRDCVDRYLDMLMRLQNFVDAGLIKIDELRPYIKYWIELASGQMQGAPEERGIRPLAQLYRDVQFRGRCAPDKSFWL